MNSYLLSLDLKYTSRDGIVSVFESTPSIENWMLFFDNTACISSESSPDELSDIIHKKIPHTQFILTRIEMENCGGWLRRSIWKFMRHPRPIDRRPREIIDFAKIGES